MVSVRNELLLTGIKQTNQLYVYNSSGHLQYNITLPNQDTFWDVTWTPSGLIAYTTYSAITVILVTPNASSVVVSSRKFDEVYHLTTATASMYLVDYKTGLYQSFDDGLTWYASRISLDSGWKTLHIAKVPRYIGRGDCCNDTDNKLLWSIEQAKQGQETVHRLSIYALNSSNVADFRCDVTLPTGVKVNPSAVSLTYAGGCNIWLTDRLSKAVHLLKINGTYKQQLLSADNFPDTEPYIAAIDVTNNLLYVGQTKGMIGVFEITDEQNR